MSILGAAVGHALPELRSEALSLMIDTARFTRGAGPPVFNPETGELEPGAATVIYEGPCRLRAPSAVEAERLFGEEQVTVTRFVAVVPYNVTGIRVGDSMTMTATGDPDAAARTWRVVVVPSGSDLVLRAIGVESLEDS